MALTTFVLRSSALARIRIKALHQTALWPSVPLRATIGQVLAGERHNVGYHNMKDQFQKALCLAQDLPADVAAAFRGEFEIEEHTFDASYIEFLDEQISLEPRGEEWTARLKDRKHALSPYANKLLLRASITVQGKDVTLEVDPSVPELIYWEIYD